MSAARTNPELLPTVQGEPPEEALILPLRSMTKAEIDARADEFVNTALEIHDTADLYVYAKQMEAAVEAVIAKLSEPAFNGFGNRFAGEKGGTVLGHTVKLSWPERWVYPEGVQKMEAQQKLELKAAQAKAQADGTAFKQPQPGRITVTLKKGGE